MSLILAGRRWRILTVDAERLVVKVEPAPGKRPPRFEGRGGADIHPRVRSTMRQILLGDSVPIYLDATSQAMLRRARLAAADARLKDHSMVNTGNGTLWFTWTGSRIHRVLDCLARMATSKNVDDEDIALHFAKLDMIEIGQMYQPFLECFPTINELISHLSRIASEKYDRYLSKELLNQVFAERFLDVDGARQLLLDTFGLDGTVKSTRDR